MLVDTSSSADSPRTRVEVEEVEVEEVDNVVTEPDLEQEVDGGEEKSKVGKIAEGSPGKYK